MLLLNELWPWKLISEVKQNGLSSECHNVTPVWFAATLEFMAVRINFWEGALAPGLQ